MWWGVGNSNMTLLKTVMTVFIENRYDWFYWTMGVKSRNRDMTHLIQYLVCGVCVCVCVCVCVSLIRDRDDWSLLPILHSHETPVYVCVCVWCERWLISITDSRIYDWDHDSMTEIMTLWLRSWLYDWDQDSMTEIKSHYRSHRHENR